MNDFQKKLIEQKYDVAILSMQENKDNQFIQEIKIKYKHKKLDHTVNWHCVLPYHQTLYERFTIMIKRDLREMGAEIENK